MFYFGPNGRQTSTLPPVPQRGPESDMAVTEDPESPINPPNGRRSISKIFEKVVFKRLYTFINDKLYPSQYGFRQKHSTIHAVTEFHNDIINYFENKQKTIATFLDLSKAFDTIDHHILQKKLVFEAYPSTGLKVTLVIVW